MKVLMFGWEFPPHILGGLGTASYGLTKGMSQQEDMEITFIIGAREIPASALYGVQTLRGIENFPISKFHLNEYPLFINGLEMCIRDRNNKG